MSANCRAMLGGRRPSARWSPEPVLLEAMNKRCFKKTKSYCLLQWGECNGALQATITGQDAAIVGRSLYRFKVLVHLLELSQYGNHILLHICRSIHSC